VSEKHREINAGGAGGPQILLPGFLGKLKQILRAFSSRCCLCLFILGLLFMCRTPTMCFTAKTFLLFFCCDRGCPFEAKDLIHWFSCLDIIARKPALPVKRAGIFMFSPI
jgi:hypothetical protein